jgi:hypothetical protein
MPVLGGDVNQLQPARLRFPIRKVESQYLQIPCLPSMHLDTVIVYIAMW